MQNDIEAMAKTLGLSREELSSLIENPEILRVALDNLRDPSLQPPRDYMKVLEHQVETLMRISKYYKSYKENLMKAVESFRWRYDLAMIGLKQLVLVAPCVMDTYNLFETAASENRIDYKKWEFGTKWRFNEDSIFRFNPHNSDPYVMQCQWQRIFKPGEELVSEKIERGMDVTEGLFVFLYHGLKAHTFVLPAHYFGTDELYIQDGLPAIRQQWDNEVILGPLSGDYIYARSQRVNPGVVVGTRGK